MNLILFDPDEVSPDGRAVVTGPRAAHLRQVLQVSTGQTVRVGVLDGPCGTGVVTAPGHDRVELQCHFESSTPVPPRVDLLLAVPRPKVMRRLWAQLAALGVRRIILTNAARVERPYFDTHVLTPRCYRPLLVEGLQQARDTRVPQVSIHRQFRVLVEDDLDDLCGEALRLIADPDGAATIADVVGGPSPRRVLLAVGPEGGWNAFERDLLQAHGFVTVGMGPRSLRSDTACIALVALVHEALRAGGRDPGSGTRDPGSGPMR